MFRCATDCLSNLNNTLINQLTVCFAACMENVMIDYFIYFITPIESTAEWKH